MTEKICLNCKQFFFSDCYGECNKGGMVEPVGSCKDFDPKEPLKIVVPLPPVTKKNHQRIVVNKATGRRFVVPSKEYKEYEEKAGYFIRCKGENIDYPINIKCLFYMPNKRRVDLANLISGAMDLLVHYGVIADDNCNIVVSNDGSRVFVDRESPRSEFYIERIVP